MKIDDALILDYAKRIFGFAYSKTGNTVDAEDLSQDIIIVLLDKRTDLDLIENMDAYVYRICCYTWSNYFRKNKPRWEATGSSELLDFAISEENIEENYLQNELSERLRREIMYLSKTRREITIMYYYDGKSGDEISKLLGIPAATVRWHMGEIKKVLNERLIMNNSNEIYTPVKLWVGHNGWVQNYDMSGLCSDVIMQNICWICRTKPLSVEEIASTLGIAAVYLEDKLDKLLYMDYIKTVGTNKYQTTFYIRDEEFFLMNTEFGYKNILKIALPIFEIAKEMLPEYRNADILDGEFSNNFLLYAIIMPIINGIAGHISELANKRMNLSYTRPKRKDGSEHFVCAGTYKYSEVVKSVSDSGFADYILHSGGCGVKTRDTETIVAIQYDQNEFGGWRDFEQADLIQLDRIHQIIINGETPNEYDKEAIANQCKKGYVRVDNGKPVLLIPYARKGDAMNRMSERFSGDRVISRVDCEGLVDLLVAHRKEVTKILPKCLDKNEHDSILGTQCGFGSHEIIYALHKHGYLYDPDKEEQKRICTFLYEK